MSDYKRDKKRQRIKEGRESDPEYRDRRWRRKLFKRYMKRKKEDGSLEAVRG